MSKMASIPNALAFTGRYYLFMMLSKDSIDKERKRHDLVIEQLQLAQVKWAWKWRERIDFINKQLRLERKVETAFMELDDTIKEHHEVFGHQLPPLPRETVMSNFYTTNNKQHDRQLAFITLSMILVGEALWYLEN